MTPKEKAQSIIDQHYAEILEVGGEDVSEYMLISYKTLSLRLAKVTVSHLVSASNFMDVELQDYWSKVGEEFYRLYYRI